MYIYCIIYIPANSNIASDMRKTHKNVEFNLSCPHLNGPNRVFEMYISVLKRPKFQNGFFARSCLLFEPIIALVGRGLCRGSKSIHYFKSLPFCTVYK